MSPSNPTDLPEGVFVILCFWLPGILIFIVSMVLWERHRREKPPPMNPQERLMRDWWRRTKKNP